MKVNFTIPSDPCECPKQYPFVVRKILDLPSGLEVIFPPEGRNFQQHDFVGIPELPSKESISLGQVEWIWAPKVGRIDAYELHEGSTHWLLWRGENRARDPMRSIISNWFIAAYIPVDDVSERQAAHNLLKEFWNKERQETNLDKFHWINRVESVPVSELQSIAQTVWE